MQIANLGLTVLSDKASSDKPRVTCGGDGDHSRPGSSKPTFCDTIITSNYLQLWIPTYEFYRTKISKNDLPRLEHLLSCQTLLMDHNSCRVHLADPKGARDVRPIFRPISFISMQCSAKILPNNRFLPQTQRLAPPLVNPGSATGQLFLSNLSDSSN